MSSESSIDSFVENTSTLENSYFRWIENNPHQSLIYFAIIGGFAFRILAVFQANGIIHPDEIFQSLEMAHLMVYGNGNKPPEFQTTFNVEPTYAATRSWVFPLIFASILFIMDFLGFDYHGEIFPFLRLLLVVNATLLIPAASKLSYQMTKSKNVEVITALSIAFWFRLVEFSVRFISNTFFLPIMFYAIYRTLKALEKNKFSRADQFWIILGLGLTTYVRFDLGIVVGSFFISTFSKRNLEHYYLLLRSGIYGWGVGMIIDFIFYESIRVVPVNWFRFNIIEGLSSNFGTSPASYYYSELIELDGLQYFSLFITIIFAYTVIAGGFLKNLDHTPQVKGFQQLFISSLLTWMLYSNFWIGNLNPLSLGEAIIAMEFKQSHKEFRFIMSGLVVLLITISASVEALLITSFQLLNDRLPSIPKKLGDIGYLDFKHYSTLGLSAGMIFLIIGTSFNTTGDRWHVEQFMDTNEALKYVGRQADATGVLVGLQWFLSGSYAYLHKDITIEYFDFTGDPEDVAFARFNVQRLLSDWNEGNYVILPRFQIGAFPAIIDILIENKFSIDEVFQSRTEIWKRIP